MSICTEPLSREVADALDGGAASAEVSFSNELGHRSTETNQEERLEGLDQRLTCPIDRTELQLLADVGAHAAARGLSVDRALMLRFLLANKKDVSKAVKRLSTLMRKRREWEWEGIPDEDARSWLDRGAGYWNVGGPDAEGSPTAFLLQRNAVPATSLEMARAGVKAAHTFFLGLTSKVATVRNGITIVVDLNGVGPSVVAKSSNPYARKVGDAYTGVLPIRVRHFIFLNCALVLRGMVASSARAVMSGAKYDKLRFVNDKELAALVPRESWPRALRAERATPTAAAAEGDAPPATTENWAWCHARMGTLERQVAELELPPPSAEAAAAAQAHALADEREPGEEESTAQQQCTVS